MDGKPCGRSNHLLPAPGNENKPLPAGKIVHDHCKPTGHLVNMSSSRSTSTGSKRVALGERNGVPTNSGDAHDSKPSLAQAQSTATAGANQAQENHKLASSKAASQTTAMNPAQRPPKNAVRSVSVGHSKYTVQPAQGQRTASGKATQSSYHVYKDVQGGKTELAPAKASTVAPEHWSVQVLRATQEQPSNTLKPQPKQEQPVEPVPLGTGLNLFAEAPRPQGTKAVRGSKHEAHPQKHASSSAAEYRFHGPVEGETALVPVPRCQRLPLQQMQFLTNAPEQFVNLPEPSHVPRLVPISRSHRERGPHFDPQCDSTPPGLDDDQAYVSDYNDEEEYYPVDQGCSSDDKSRRPPDDNSSCLITAMMPPKVTVKDKDEIVAARKLVENLRTPEEIQADDADITLLEEYGKELFDYMLEQENMLLPNPHYMDSQLEVTWSLRGTLLDWIVQVHGRFALFPETLFLTANLIDRFLTIKVVSGNKLQLVGASALLIAGKYEEINCPSVQELVFMVGGAFSGEEIVKAERYMLSMLEFDLGWPGPMSFLRRISKADDYNLETRTLAKYFLEVALMDERFVATPASYTAAGAHCLARLMLHLGPWTPGHVHFSGYTFSQLKPLLAMLLACCRHGRKHHPAVYDKYCDELFNHGARYVEEEIRKGFVLPFEHSLPILMSSDTFHADATVAPFAGMQTFDLTIQTQG